MKFQKLSVSPYCTHVNDTPALLTLPYYLVEPRLISSSFLLYPDSFRSRGLKLYKQDVILMPNTMAKSNLLIDFFHFEVFDFSGYPRNNTIQSES